MFKSEEEIVHWFLPRPDIVTCYVVEVRAHIVFGGGGKEEREAKEAREKKRREMCEICSDIMNLLALCLLCVHCTYYFSTP